MSKAERVAIFIDGSNLYFKLKTSPSLPKHTLSFDFGEFVALLALGREITSKSYYVGAVRTKPTDKKGQKLRKNQQRLFSQLQKSGLTIVRGYLMKNDGVYHEKGVDVRLAIDIVKGAIHDSYDTALIISSDTDLLPAIKEAQLLGKKVEYVGFGHAPSFGLLKVADSSRLLQAVEVKLLYNQRAKVKS